MARHAQEGDDAVAIIKRGCGTRTNAMGDYWSNFAGLIGSVAFSPVDKILASAAEAVQDEQRPQCFGPWPEAEFRPDISRDDNRPSDQTECDAYEKPGHLLWHDSVSSLEFQPLTATGGADRDVVTLPGTAGLAVLAMACSRRHTMESGANCGSDGKGRRSSRS
jgi:hypothetical protein